jgi:Glycine-zipper domain
MLNRPTSSIALAVALASCALLARAQTATQPAPQAAQTAAPAAGKDLASSAGVMVYPSKGQSADQQAQDEAQCFSWAREQSGYDPMNPPPPPRAPLPATDHSGDVARGAVGGAAVGAAGGALIGAIAGNAGKGAGIGAAAGLLTGGIRAHDREERDDETAKAQAQASLDEQRAARQELTQKFRRAMSVCLEARGYATK